MIAAQPTLQLEENPFRKREGDCEKCSATAVRIYWCHICLKLFCWECFKTHAD